MPIQLGQIQFGAIQAYQRMAIRDAFEQQTQDPSRDVVALGIERLDTPTSQHFGVPDMPYFLLTLDKASDTDLADLRRILHSPSVELVSRVPDLPGGNQTVENMRRQLNTGSPGKRLLLRVYSYARSEPGTYLLKNAAVDDLLALAQRGGFSARPGLHYTA